MEGLSIEICYSKGGGDRFIKAEQNAAILIAQLLKERGWGIDKVTKHQDYANKYCPHRTLDMGWDRFINMVKNAMGGVTPQPTPIEELKITYQTWDDVKNTWLPNVINDTDYAGIYGHDVCAVYANSNKNDVIYKVHYKGGKWLPEVRNREDYAGIYNKPIDGFMIKGVNAYRVHLRRQNRWLGWVTGYNENDSNNGYAGILGQEIDAIQIK